MSAIQTSIGILVALALAALLYRRYSVATQRRAEAGSLLFGDVLPLLDGGELLPGEAAGTWKVVGEYRSETFQLQSVVDTLSTRKLPCLWLMVTLPKPHLVSATIDMMMRPSGPTTFSNFDFLGHTLQMPDGFPESAVIRSDTAGTIVPTKAIKPHLDLFITMRAKELLMSPKGLRIVVQIAEADRARYGVLREANFGETVIDLSLAKRVMDALIEMKNDLTDARET